MAGYCEKVAAIQDRRSVLYHSFEEATLKLKANKDTSSFQSAIKKITGEGQGLIKWSRKSDNTGEEERSLDLLDFVDIESNFFGTYSKCLFLRHNIT